MYWCRTMLGVDQQHSIIVVTHHQVTRLGARVHVQQAADILQVVQQLMVLSIIHRFKTKHVLLSN